MQRLTLPSLVTGWALSSGPSPTATGFALPRSSPRAAPFSFDFSPVGVVGYNCFSQSPRAFASLPLSPLPIAGLVFGMGHPSSPYFSGSFGHFLHSPSAMPTAHSTATLAAATASVRFRSTTNVPVDSAAECAAASGLEIPVAAPRVRHQGTCPHGTSKPKCFHCNSVIFCPTPDDAAHGPPSKFPLRYPDVHKHGGTRAAHLRKESCVGCAGYKSYCEKGCGHHFNTENSCTVCLGRKKQGRQGQPSVTDDTEETI